MLDLPHSTVLSIVCNHGKKLNLIRKNSGACVNLLTKIKGNGPSKLNISGTPSAVSFAINLVKEVIEVYCKVRNYYLKQHYVVNDTQNKFCNSVVLVRTACASIDTILLLISVSYVTNNLFF